MSTEMALQIIESNPYRYSVYARDSMLTEIGKQLSIDDSRVYILRDLKKEQYVYDISAITNNLIYFAFLVAGILVSLFVVTLITSFVLGTKKKELGVLRVIGLSEKDVLNVLHFELLFLMSLSIVITIVFAFITTIVDLPFEFGLFFDDKIKLIASIIVLLVMGYFISLGWNKRMFKKSAREVLKVGDSL
jgi:ABC-type antimicrobial peptide transport system permease subunit